MMFVIRPRLTAASMTNVIAGRPHRHLQARPSGLADWADADSLVDPIGGQFAPEVRRTLSEVTSMTAAVVLSPNGGICWPMARRSWMNAGWPTDQRPSR